MKIVKYAIKIFIIKNWSMGFVYIIFLIVQFKTDFVIAVRNFLVHLISCWAAGPLMWRDCGNSAYGSLLGTCSLPPGTASLVVGVVFSYPCLFFVGL